MIPPWVRPESPETIRTIDDATSAFPPAFGRGMTQRGIWADPRWGLRRRYRGLRSDEKAAILNALNESRGQLNVLRVTPHMPLRGSFATSEVLSNNSFVSGTSGWSAYSTTGSLTTSDRVARVTRVLNNATNAIGLQNSAAITTLTQYAPYVVRGFIKNAMAASATGLVAAGTTSGGIELGTSSSIGGAGLASLCFVPLSVTSIYILASDGVSAGSSAGDYLDVQYMSLARCAQVDNGANILLQSDAFNTTWAATRGSVSVNSVAAPDGNTTGDTLVEDSSTNTHYVEQAVTISSASLDYALTVAIRAGGRTWAAMQMIEGGGSNVTAYYNLSTGAVGTTATGVNWSNLRTFTVDLGGGWYACTLIAKKLLSASSITNRIYTASADNTASYAGNGASGIHLWRATQAQSSVPTRQVRSTTAAVAASGQTGSAIYTKGWPASISGLLLAGDWLEINGELKQVTAPVNSNSAGLAFMQFRPGLAGAPADNDPIIVQEPFGRFIYAGGTREFENMFGVYGDCEMNLEEVYS